jgi:hypothetical protein
VVVPPGGGAGGLTSGPVNHQISPNSVTSPRHRRRRPRLALTACGTVLAVAIVLSGCGKSLNAIVGSTSTTQDPVTANGASPNTTPSSSGEVAVAFPVTACSTAFGTPLPAGGWKPSVLLAPIPTALVGKVEFYTDGTHTLLGPYGWNCAEWSAVPGSTGLAVYPPTSTPPAVNVVPQPGTEGVFASFTTTGTTQGVAQVCHYFTVAKFQARQFGCLGSTPAGEQSTLATPDVAALTDPAGVTGALPGSGGPHRVTGVLIFPQVMPAVTNGTAVDIAMESCSLVAVNLCPTVISDFEVREFPIPTSGFHPTATPTTPNATPVHPAAPTTVPVPVPTTPTTPPTVPTTVAPVVPTPPAAAPPTP